MPRKEVFIDFDGTITSSHGFNHPPKEGAVEAINTLYDSEECFIVIYSCRANPQVCDPTDVLKMKRYLDQHGIKYHGIEPGKPHFTYIIDDRSLNPNLTTWANIQSTIMDK